MKSRDLDNNKESAKHYQEQNIIRITSNKRKSPEVRNENVPLRH